ncbi:hypothetical protein BFJ63_vAg17860 [Fusarium oxysporum f. sp. narcissi]|uniref:Rhodopsin domain-containing protein n=1 Tax=Fusarium oxysporum f. sp. narcissi TaxID=451672 RepID=A0A4Q2UZS4_FUSOX|nr:hypothetical protein BFJ63_vAg17860 [Fusarium oxysporum f. sp. narcissi]
MDDVTYFSNANVGSVLIIPHAIFSAIATLFVGLRLYTARYVTKNEWCTDEYGSIIALVANHIMLISEGISVSLGLGSNIVKIQTEFPGGLSSFLKSILGIECAYGLACPLSKMAVLAMYYHIFSTSRLLRYCTWVMASMMAGWGIAVVGVSIFTCTPVHGFWDKSIPSKCIDSTRFYIGITIPNIIFDVCTVVLPVREVWKLQMGRDKKWALTTIFLLGGSVVLASIARLVLFFIYQPGSGPSGNNISQTVLFPHTASAIETCLAIIGACLPPCAPLLKRVLSRVVTTVTRDTSSGKTDDRSNFGTLVTIGKISNRAGVTSKRHRDDDVEGSFERLDDNGSLQGSTDGLYVDGSGRTNKKKGSRPQIHVRREVEVESSDGSIPLRNL